MKSISQLTDFYYKELYPILQELEEDRKALRKKAFIIFAILGVIALGLVSVIGIDQNLEISMFVLFGMFVLGGIIFKFISKDYVEEFKDRVIEPLIKEIDSKLTYSKHVSIPSSTFERSELFSHPDRYSGNDLVRGSIDATKLEFSDVHAQKEHRDSKGNRSHSTIFQGLFIVTEFPKEFHGKTMVLPDVAQSTFGDLIGNWLQEHNFGRNDLVKMDNVEFEKEFVVYSTDQIEARYILTPAFMERVMTFQKKSGHKTYISFIGDHMYVAIYYNKDLFEPAVFSSLLDYKVAMEYIKTLHLVVGMVEELKLNQKLWSKR